MKKIELHFSKINKIVYKARDKTLIIKVNGTKN